MWETTVDRRPNLNREVLLARLVRDGIVLKNLSASIENTVGGYLWRGRLRLRHNRFLVGSYEAVERNMIYTGTLFCVLHHSGRFMQGRWVGCNYDGDLASGVVILARDVTVAEDRFTEVQLPARSRNDLAPRQTAIDLEEE